MRAVLMGTVAFISGSVLAQTGTPAPAQNDAIARKSNWPRAQSPAAITDPATEARITALLARMSIEQKVGQTIQADISTFGPKDLANYPLGSVLAGGNSGPYGN
ncbi:MAG: 1,4-beta-D-glucan glucohydrolase, partial [Polymorphobacter sp.]